MDTGSSTSTDVEVAKPERVELEHEEIDKTVEKKLVRRQDCILSPLMAMSLFFGYLDRGNIGNARLLGMQKDLHLSTQQYLNCVMMFFIGYMIVELPAGMALRYIHPRYVFSGSLVLFGLFATLFTIAGYGGVLALRFWTGIFEAVVNNCFIFISIWYRPEELALRTGELTRDALCDCANTETAALYSLTPIAGVASGLIAYGVGENLKDVNGIHAWQWLFLIEGVMTIGWGLFVILPLLPGLPETVAAKGAIFFRNEDQRHVITQRLVQGQNTSHAGFQWHQVVMALKDPKFWLGAIAIGPVGIGIGAFNVFMPTFMHAFGYSELRSQLMSIIPYSCALISMLSFAYIADRYKMKANVTLVSMAITIIGFIILLSTGDKVAGLVACCFVAAGAYPALVIGVSWALTFHGGYTKRATAVWGFQVVLQTYSIVATEVFRNAPRFYLGMGISLGGYIVGFIAVIALKIITKRANAARDARKADFERRGEVDLQMQQSFEELGDFHPGFRYVE